MAKVKSGILYHGDFEGKYLWYLGEFKNKTEQNKLINEYLKKRKVEKVDGNYVLKHIIWKDAEQNTAFVDETIDYGNNGDFILVMYDL